MAETTQYIDPATDKAHRRKLARLQLREQRFYVLLVLPVVLFILMFLIVPIFTLFLRSFEDGKQGLPVALEIANEMPDGFNTTFTVDKTPLADRNGDGQINADDLQKLLVIRPVDILSITPDTGAVVMAEEPSEFETIHIVYNDIGPLEPEIGIRLPGDRRDAITLKDVPIKDNNGDGRVTKADVNLQFAEELGRSNIIAFNADVGAITLVEPPIPGRLVAVSYNYSNPVTIFQYDRALGTDFYWDWAFWRPSLFRTTFEITLWITMGCLVIGYPVAYFLANVSNRWRTILIPLVVIPLWTSLLVRTFAWKVMLGVNGPVNDIIQGIGVSDEPLGLAFNESRLGVYIGTIHIMLPFFILPLFAVMRGIPQHLPRVAESMGASPIRSFLRVYLPLSLPGVAAGCLLVFILSIGFFITPALLGGAGDRMIGNMIELQVNELLNWEFGAALSFLLLTMTLVIFLVWSRFTSFDQLHGGGVQAVVTGEHRVTRNPIQRFTTYLAPQWRPLTASVEEIVTFLQRRREVVWEAIQDWLRSLPSGITATISIALALGIVVLLAGFIYDADWKLVIVSLICLPIFVAVALLGARLFQASIRRAMLTLFVALALFYLFLPNIFVIPMSFTRQRAFFSFPGECCTLENYESYLGIFGAGRYTTTGQWIPATITSLEVAFLVMIFSVTLGTLAAYGLIRGQFPGRLLINSLIIAPLIIPLVIIAVGVFIFFSSNMDFMLGSLVSVGPFDIPLGFVVAHSLLAIPFVVIIVSASLRGVDATFERAAMSLGAGRFTTLRRVVFPQILPAIVASSFFAFLISFDELIIALFLSTGTVVTLPKKMWDGIRFEIDPTITAISTILVFFTILVIGVMALSQLYFSRRRSDG